jgi:hypothetical protein
VNWRQTAKQRPCMGCGRIGALTKGQCAGCYWRVGQPRRACVVCGEVRPICSRGACNTCRKRRVVHGIVGADEQLRRGPVPCDICGATNARTVDHDHESGLARGKLCKACNVGLGSFRDEAELLEKAAAYLRRVKREDSPAEGQKAEGA